MSLIVQQGDVLLQLTGDGGEISVTGGIVSMAGSLETMALLCLFGGNTDDDGSADNAFTYWGNLSETEPSKRYVSKTQNILKGLPLSASNLNKVDEAVRFDTQVFLDENIASSVEVETTIPGINTLKIVLRINADEREQVIEFILVWNRDIEANS